MCIDILNAKQSLKYIIAAECRVLADPAPEIVLGNPADFSVNFTAGPWAKSGIFWALLWDTTESVKVIFKEAGPSIPYPDMDIPPDRDAQAHPRDQSYPKLTPVRNDSMI
ncbi:MAG: hypothetical protein P8J17_14145 [Halioglobus sp.]|nr:hypothetical protein [Halioglobus sp.]